MSDAVQKSKRGYNYSYADITDILASISVGMEKYGVSLIPQIKPGTTSVEQNVTRGTKFNKKGDAYENITTEMLVQCEMVFTWVDNDNPGNHIDVPWFMTGSQSDPSQAFGSGLTYSTRYFLCNYFQIAQTDTDVDTYRSKQKEAEESENKAIVESIISKLDSEIKEFLADNPDKQEEIKALASKYAKAGNYKSIREPNLASKLLKEFEDTYIKKEGNE